MLHLLMPVAATLSVALATATACAADPITADVVVYGDTSGGVTAAVQASRMGKTTIVISPTGHLGGMTSSGLGWTDLGNRAILGGLSREFYHRVYEHYQGDDAWAHEQRAGFRNQGQGEPSLDPATKLATTFEPHVAEAVFNDLAAEAQVRRVTGRLDLAQPVRKDGTPSRLAARPRLDAPAAPAGARGDSAAAREVGPAQGRVS